MSLTLKGGLSFHTFLGTSDLKACFYHVQHIWINLLLPIIGGREEGRKGGRGRKGERDERRNGGREKGMKGEMEGGRKEGRAVPRHLFLSFCKIV